jgi:hypothetical protein
LISPRCAKKKFLILKLIRNKSGLSIEIIWALQTAWRLKVLDVR